MKVSCAVLALLAMVIGLSHCYPVDQLLAQDSTQQQQIILIPANILKQAQQDLVASASENHQEDHEPSESGHHHGHHEHHGHGGGHHGHDASGYLDMGAYSGKHGAFGWYADFPVGHH